MSSVLPGVGIAVAITVPVLLAIPKAASLRDAVYSKWASRVDLTYAGLSERAVTLLRRLQHDTEELLGDETVVDPDAALEDPAQVAHIANNFQKTIAVRGRLNRRFRALLRLAVAVPVLALFYVAGVWLVTAHYLSWLNHGLLPNIGFWMVGAALSVGFALALAFFYLEWKLSSADMMSKPPASASKKKR